MKSLDILRLLLAEAHIQLRASTSRDWQTCKSRHEHEGDSFIGITLPLFSQWIERSIEEGRVESSIYSSFRKRAGGRSVLPCFLHGLTTLVFEAKTGLVRSDMDESAVYFIRQICSFGKREFTVCSPERTAKAISSYEQLDLSLRDTKDPPASVRLGVETLTSAIVPRLENLFRQSAGSEAALPKHGPGATAEGLSPNTKFTVRDFYRRWRGVLSWEELYGYHTVQAAGGREIFESEELPAKVVAVPKTMKTARIICVEPAAMQYAQQLTAARLISAIESLGIAQQLNFNDQQPNQRLAREGSLPSGSWATLDLSEASDRLTLKAVRELFSSAPHLLRHLVACRTGRAKLPSGRVLPLRKYASMGSALTFPVEALCFYFLCVAAVNQHLVDSSIAAYEEGRVKSTPHRRYLLEKAKRLVYVFGDDIIVPKDSVGRVVEFLTAYGLKVNANKSFSKGLFRESCGHDYVNGAFVTPVYVRRPAPLTIRDAESLVSWVAMCNRFHACGLWHTANAIREYLDSVFRFPLVSSTCEGLGYTYYSETYSPSVRKNGDWYVRTLVPTSKKVKDPMDGESALLASLLRLEREGEVRWECGSVDDLRSPKRHSLRLRLKTVRAY